MHIKVELYRFFFRKCDTKYSWKATKIDPKLWLESPNVAKIKIMLIIDRFEIVNFKWFLGTLNKFKKRFKEQTFCFK